MAPDLPHMFKVNGSQVKVTAWRNGAEIYQIINNSVRDCSISIKFITDYDHVTTDLPQTFKVNGSKLKVIAWHDVLALKIVTFHERITSLSLNFVQTIAKHSATRDTGSRSYKVKYSNRNNSTADCLIAFKFGTEFDHGTASIEQTFTVTGQSSRSQRNAMSQQ